MVTKRTQKVVLFVEGTSDDSNGDLRQGFESLLKKELAGKMPIIKLGNGINQTINKFKNTEGGKLLLIDLDGVSDTRTERLKAYNLPENKAFFMVQAMEAWFLSQPDMLKTYYKTDLKIPKKHANEISKPDVELQKITKNSVKKEYHKVRHAVELLSKLDVKKLQNDFPDFKNLLDALKKA
jgi:hypothetical protein